MREINKAQIDIINENTRLKVRLKLKRLRAETKELRRQNFGYYPSSPIADAVLDELDRYETVARLHYKDVWDAHIDLI